jgi:hypothetical protein
VVAIGILKKEGHTVTFMQYVKIGAIVVLVQLILATGYLFAASKYTDLLKQKNPEGNEAQVLPHDNNSSEGH